MPFTVEFHGFDHAFMTKPKRQDSDSERQPETFFQRVVITDSVHYSSLLSFSFLFLIERGIYIQIGSLFLENPFVLVNSSPSEVFNTQLETSLLIVVDRL